jgi:hypothetical protein
MRGAGARGLRKKGRKVMGGRDVKTARVHLVDDGRRGEAWRGKGGKAKL